ncbi:MAG TPA: sigma-70 family RNA polymerase sigma factor [Rhodanobacter sp.]|nr:sigma-70 family RNA polymerase sigma factor [Rhodanobacter sp.]
MREEEFTTLLREHAGLLSRIAASYEADTALRDDLLQDMALALWRGLPAWRGDAPLKAYIARVAHNRGATHVVGQLRRSPALALSEQWVDSKHGPDDYTQLEQHRLRLQGAVRALPLARRQVVTLALEGFSHAEIAQALGISVGNVAVRLNRAKSTLGVVLGGIS